MLREAASMDETTRRPRHDCPKNGAREDVRMFVTPAGADGAETGEVVVWRCHACETDLVRFVDGQRVTT
jgi:hypothetical protein